MLDYRSVYPQPKKFCPSWIHSVWPWDPHRGSTKRQLDVGGNPWWNPPVFGILYTQLDLEVKKVWVYIYYIQNSLPRFMKKPIVGSNFWKEKLQRLPFCFSFKGCVISPTFWWANFRPSKGKDAMMHMASCIKILMGLRNPGSTHQLRLVVYPIIYKVLNIPGGCFGFLNHQQYVIKICIQVTPLITETLKQMNPGWHLNHRHSQGGDLNVSSIP